MDAYKQLLDGVQWVLSNCTSYEVAKELNINNRTVNRYQNGSSAIENMSLETAYKLYSYYMDVMKMKNIDKLARDLYEAFDWQIENNANADPQIYVLNGEFNLNPRSVSHGEASDARDKNAEVIFTKEQWKDVEFEEVDVENGRINAIRKAIIDTLTSD